MLTETAPDDALDAIDGLVRHLFALVGDGLAKATMAFLEHDREAANALIAADTEFGTLQDEVEAQVERLLADPGSGNLTFLLSVLRIVPELERSGDLVEHIALRTAHGVVAHLTQAARDLLSGMGNVGVQMWRTAAAAYAVRDGSAASRLRLMDDELDDLHVRLTEELAGGSMPPAAAIELGLVARFYERLGDHAVNVARRLPLPVIEGAKSA